jgi:hypothetical protein
MPSNVYVNNLSPWRVNLTVSFPGNVIADGDWALLQPTLEPFDAGRHEVAWVTRDIGIKNGKFYTMLVDVRDPETSAIIFSVNIGLKGSLTSSDITIGAQSSAFVDTGNAKDGPYTHTWTDAQGHRWRLDYDYGPSNSSLYHDVVYTLALVSLEKRP